MKRVNKTEVLNDTTEDDNSELTNHSHVTQKVMKSHLFEEIK